MEILITTYQNSLEDVQHHDARRASDSPTDLIRPAGQHGSAVPGWRPPKLFRLGTKLIEEGVEFQLNGYLVSY